MAALRRGILAAETHAAAAAARDQCDKSVDALDELLALQRENGNYEGQDAGEAARLLAQTRVCKAMLGLAGGQWRSKGKGRLKSKTLTNDIRAAQEACEAVGHDAGAALCLQLLARLVKETKGDDAQARDLLKQARSRGASWGGPALRADATALRRELARAEGPRIDRESDEFLRLLVIFRERAGEEMGAALPVHELGHVLERWTGSRAPPPAELEAIAEDMAPGEGGAVRVEDIYRWWKSD